MDSLSFLYSLRNKGSRFGIERMSKLASLLGDPQDRFPCIHVAGTNGKGSVCAMLDSVYRAHGYKVGLFSSPHLFELGERVRINGKNLKLEHILDWVEQIKKIAEKISEEGEDWYPSFFEFMTAVAFLEFSKQEVDVAIIETGLGGRLDSTNIVTPELSVITSIALDHCEILGDSLREIAREKAGILKYKIPVIWGWLPQEAQEELLKVAREKKCDVSDLKDLEDSQLPPTNLFGSHQSRNAALVKQAVSILANKFPVNQSLVLQALLNVSLEGRWQTVQHSPRLILDGCHNGGAVKPLVKNLQTLSQKVELWYASCGEQRAMDVLPRIIPFCSSVTFFTLNQPRACSISWLNQLIPVDFSGPVYPGDTKDVQSILDQTPKKKTILVTGSLYLVGEVLGRIRKNPFHEGVDLQDIW